MNNYFVTENIRWCPRKTPCVNSFAGFSSVGLVESKYTFYILWFGHAFSIFIFVLEVIFKIFIDKKRPKVDDLDLSFRFEYTN